MGSVAKQSKTDTKANKIAMQPGPSESPEHKLYDG